MSSEWHCLVKDREPRKTYLPSMDAVDHPLKQLTVTMLDSRTSNRKTGTQPPSSNGSQSLSLDPLSSTLDGSDPLSQFVKQIEIDPLSQMVAEMDASPMQSSQLMVNAEPWSARRSAILNRFTTAERLTIVTSFLTGGEMIKTQQSSISEKVKHRLEQLDDFDEGSVRQMLDLTQQEYVQRIEQLNQELVQAWNCDQRVKALKIAIQCSKLLADTTVMQFYPSQFVLITDILDIFGKLVYERLRTKAGYFKPGSKVATALPENFTPEMVPESAKETCQNWFYKIASIRELLPRFYVETAILKSYSFLTQNEFNQALLRLTKMIRGIGDPLVATYARCYLCRVGMTVTVDRDYLKENLYDFLTVYHTIFSSNIKTEIVKQRLDLSGYLSLYTPALDWIMQTIASRSTDILLKEIITKCQEKPNNGLLLNSILTSFAPDFIAQMGLQFVAMIGDSHTEDITKGQLLKSLGVCLTRSPPPVDQRAACFTRVWKEITALTNTAEYISCVEAWSRFITSNFGLSKVNILLDDVLTRMNLNRTFEQHYPELQAITSNIVQYCDDLEGLLILDNFLPLLDIFQKESVKLDVCKNIMLAFKNNSKESTNDPIVTNSLTYISKILNDAVNALTMEDERRQISNLISSYIRKVDYGREYNSNLQLTFYVEARAAFPNLDGVLTTLVHCVNRLAVDIRRMIGCQHTRKTAAFVKACAAYCFITIPSIVSTITRLELYLLSGEVALQNSCLGQADACFDAALNLIPELPRTIEVDGKQRTTETYLVSYLCHFLSTLVIVPDSPEQGVLYLAHRLMEVLKQYPFDAHTGNLTQMYMALLDMLNVAAQDCYPYHIPSVVSNDELYGSDAKFLAEVNLMCSLVIDQILMQLKVLGDGGHQRLQCTYALDLFVRVVTRADIGKEKMLTLASNLWNLTMKNKAAIDPKLPGKLLLHVERLKTKSLDHAQRRSFEELTTKMKLKM